MTNEEFKQWLLGFVILGQDTALNLHRIQIIENHAHLVVEVDGQLNAENQKIMDNLLDGKTLGHLFD